MRKLLLFSCIFSCILGLFSSCDMVMDNAFKVEAMGHELYYLPVFDSLDTPYKISGWIQAQGIVYDKNDNPINWKNPAIMIRDKKGSCADFAVLFLNIAHYGMKQDGEIVSVTASSRKIESGGITANHAVCRFGDMIIEPQMGGQVNYRVDYSYSFGEVFK